MSAQQAGDSPLGDLPGGAAAGRCTADGGCGAVGGRGTARARGGRSARQWWPVWLLWLCIGSCLVQGTTAVGPKKTANKLYTQAQKGGTTGTLDIESSSGSTMGDDESGWDGHNSAEDMDLAEDSDGCHLPLAEDEPAEEVKKIKQHATGTEDPDRRWGKESSFADRGIIVSANVTNFWTFLSTIDNMKGSVFANQEHGILQRNMEAAQATAFKRGYQLVAGPLDDTGHSGVAVLSRLPARAQEDKCVTEEGLQARDNGRLIVARVDLPSGMQLSVISAYGWSGSADRDMLRDRTNALLFAVRAETAARKRVPLFVGMDLNGDIQDFEQFNTANDNGELWDVGAV